MAKKNSTKSAGMVFHYQGFVDEDVLRKAFNNYFANLSTTGDEPFECPYLRTLPGSVGIIFENKPSWRYETKDLICTEGAKKGLSRRCSFGNLSQGGRGVRYEEGELRFYCPVSKINLRVKPLGIVKSSE